MGFIVRGKKDIEYADNNRYNNKVYAFK